MPRAPQSQQYEDLEQHQRATLNTLIREQVIHLLGQPDCLHKVQVRSLWQDHYRVNILLGEDAISARIAHSYFVEADSDGNIVETSPKITKQY